MRQPRGGRRIRRGSGRTRGAGFTLFEVLVALVLFGAGVAALVELVTGSLRLAAGARDLAAARMYASQRIEEALRDPTPTPGTEGGPFAERYRWELATEIGPAVEGFPYREIRYRVTIRWEDGRTERSLDVVSSRWTKEDRLERE